MYCIVQARMNQKRNIIHQSSHKILEIFALIGEFSVFLLT